MCGIAGIINFNNQPVKKELLEEMIKKVRYRGPDDEGYFLAGNFGLGHCRLSIIDLSKAGHQPMSNEDGKIWIVYNGEIFNYLELRKDLEKSGHIFKSNTDTEVILHTYEEWGPDGFKNFNGMWAFGILDLNRKKLILSRDRFSIKPLYYATINKNFYFASEIKQILPFLERREINLEVLLKFLKQGLLDFNEKTFFEGIFKVKPRHNLIINLENNRLEEREYWNYQKEYFPENEIEIIERFRDLFLDSVRIRLRSDVEVGGLLSGGLDSSSIAVIANELTGNKFQCFSVISENKKYSEEKFIDILSKEKNLKIKKLLLKPQLSWERLEEVIFHQEEPFGSFGAVAQNQVLELIKKETDITVLFSGQGGDEILCGYRKFFFFYLAELWEQKRFFNVFENIFFSLLYKNTLWQFFKETNLWPVARKYFPEKVVPLDKILKIKIEPELIGRADTLAKRQILDINKYSVPSLTHYEDRNSMAHSLEIRLPFLDYRLVNFMINLPDFFKIRYGWSKYILRKALKELPKEIAWRRTKRGFTTPQEKWLKEDFKDRIMELFLKSELAKIGVVDKKQLIESYRGFLGGKREFSYFDFIRFVITEIWLKMIFYGKRF